MLPSGWKASAAMKSFAPLLGAPETRCPCSRCSPPAQSGYTGTLIEGIEIAGDDGAPIRLLGHGIDRAAGLGAGKRIMRTGIVSLFQLRSAAPAGLLSTLRMVSVAVLTWPSSPYFPGLYSVSKMSSLNSTRLLLWMGMVMDCGLALLAAQFNVPAVVVKSPLWRQVWRNPNPAGAGRCGCFDNPWSIEPTPPGLRYRPCAGHRPSRCLPWTTSGTWSAPN